LAPFSPVGAFLPQNFPEANRFFFQLSGKKSAQQPKTMGEMPTPPKISEGVVVAEYLSSQRSVPGTACINDVR
jgi:hypothetical protein